MEIDRKTLKALSADTRIDILKNLKTRRKTPSELSKEMGLAPSTIIEHLNKLEKANLIRREETGHKWIYYNLTDKGRSIVAPKYPVQFIIMLSLGIIFVFSGMFRYFSLPLTFGAERGLEAPLAQATSDAVEETAKNFVAEGAPIPVDWLMYGLFAVGIILILTGLVRIKKR